MTAPEPDFSPRKKMDRGTTTATATSLRRLVIAIIAFAVGLYIGAMLIFSSRPDNSAAPPAPSTETTKQLTTPQSDSH